MLVLRKNNNNNNNKSCWQRGWASPFPSPLSEWASRGWLEGVGILGLPSRHRPFLCEESPLSLSLSVIFLMAFCCYCIDIF